MATHWTDKRSAVAMVGAELARRGWTLYGWTDDASDAMTDYFAPAHWDGVATRDGATVCVDVSGYTVSSNSGGRDRVRYVPDPAATCDRCHGERLEPGAPTLDEARARGGVVSPIGYFGHGWGVGHPDGDEFPREFHGRRRCSRCAGRGHMLRQETYREPWPTFQANAKGCTWHVERDGRILAQGTGVYAVAGERYDGRHGGWNVDGPVTGSDGEVTCTRCGKVGMAHALRGEDCPAGRPKLRALVDRIEAAARAARPDAVTCADCGGAFDNLAELDAHDCMGRAMSDAVRSGEVARLAEDTAYAYGVTQRPGRRPGVVELVFRAKPPDTTRMALKRSGFRWAPSNGCWYGPADNVPACLLRVAS